MNTERVEAAAKALWNATLPGIAWDELREASREPVRVQARAALTADDAASGERVVWYNGPASGYTIVIDDWMRKTFTEVGPRQITIEVRGEELVVRKVRANG